MALHSSALFLVSAYYIGSFSVAVAVTWSLQHDTDSSPRTGSPEPQPVVWRTTADNGNIVSYNNATVEYENIPSDYSSTSTIQSHSGLPCPPNYYAPVGSPCVLCACKKALPCDVSGACKSCRSGRFRPDSGCIYGIISLKNTKVNPWQPMNVTCTIRTVVAENDSQGINESRVILRTGDHQGRLQEHWPSSRHSNGSVTELHFSLNNGLEASDNITCSLSISSDGTEVSRTIPASLYDLPAVTRPPRQHGDLYSQNYVTILIDRWNKESGDTGDGPVAHYVVDACLVKTEDNCESGNNFYRVTEIPSFDMPVSVVNLMNKFTLGATYTFVYRAGRPGYNGIGVASPPLTLKIPCKKPSKGPILSPQYTMELNHEFKQVNVTIKWNLPESHTVNCDRITEVTARFLKEGGDVLDYSLPGNHTSLRTSVEPYTLYTVVVSVTNNANLSSTGDVIQLNRTPAVAPNSPTITSIYMYNSSSSVVEWLEPRQTFGEILHFEVFYASASEGNSNTKSSCKEDSGWKRNRTYRCSLNLELNSTYKVWVRAMNAVGYGDNSSEWTYTALLTEPGEITRFSNVSKTDGSIFLSWEEPENKGGSEITRYKLTCMGGNMAVEFGVPNHTMSYNVTGLHAGTMFTCRVSACNEYGCGSSSADKIVYTLPPVLSPPPIPMLLDWLSRDTSLTLKLQKVPNCQWYMVIVEIDNSPTNIKRFRRDANEGLASCGTNCADSGGELRCYVAAKMSAENLTERFVVGDGQSYGGYCNPPLTTGQQYVIWYAAGNEVDGVSSYQYSSLENPAIVGEYAESRESGMPAGVVAGIITAVVSTIGLAMVLLYFLIRQRRNKQMKFRTPDREKVEELRENGGLVHQRDSMSLDSQDKQANGEPVYDNVKLKQYPVLLEELREYIQQKNANDGFKKEYNLIAWGLKYPHEVAKHSDNKHKNRYGNIIAYDHSRVVLHDKDLDQDTDYINANYIDGYSKEKEYIATQGPTKFTVNDLWHMAWQERSSLIVMVTNTVELSRNKCEQYWPDSGSMQCGSINVTAVSTKSLAHYKLRAFKMEKNEETRSIEQFHFTAWPDHGTPNHATTLLSFLKKVRQHKDPSSGPIICHCSAGVGRTGTFIALDALLQQAQTEGRVDVYGFVTKMRKQRCNMIQTLDQYLFLHDAILEASQGFDTCISLATFKASYEGLRTKPSASQNQITLQFKKLQEIQYTDKVTEALAPENKDKNRDCSVIPFNHRRVRLQSMTSDYINASYIDDHRKHDALVATQHPLTSTIEDFWKMVQGQRPLAIVTLCAASVERKDLDLPIFWPVSLSETKDFTAVSVELLEQKSYDCMPSVLVQKLSITGNSQVFQLSPIEVDHYVCTFWDVNDLLPVDKASLMSLIMALEKRKQDNEDRPLIINCLDGAKQSGVYVACHTLLQQMLMDHEVDVPEILKLIRNNQPQFLSSVEQYQFCYEFISDYLEKQD